MIKMHFTPMATMPVMLNAFNIGMVLSDKAHQKFGWHVARAYGWVCTSVFVCVCVWQGGYRALSPALKETNLTPASRACEDNYSNTSRSLIPHTNTSTHPHTLGRAFDCFDLPRVVCARANNLDKQCRREIFAPLSPAAHIRCVFVRVCRVLQVSISM